MQARRDNLTSHHGLDTTTGKSTPLSDVTQAPRYPERDAMWALFGTAIKTYLHNPRLKAGVNILLSLSLIYTAIALAGIV
jgi:hypothetical protein